MGVLRFQRLGEMLIERGKIEAEDLERALELQRERGDKLGKILVDMGLVAQRDVLAALSEQLGVPLIAIDGPPASAPEIEGLSHRFLRQARVFPAALNGSVLTLAMADPMDFESAAAVRAFSGLEIQTALAPEQEIVDAVDKHYADGERQALTGVEDEEALADLEHLRDMASEAPVIRLVNAMIADALEKRASDIHIEPFEKEFRVRFRVDGVLVQPGTAAARAEGGHHIPPETDGQAEHRRAAAAAGRPHQDQDSGARGGSARFHAADALRRKRGHAAAGPLGGRFLRSAPAGLRRPHASSSMEHFTGLPHGIFLVTGPTGSGKSTTLYSALKRINLPDKKIITIEDPVEYQMDGINQIHVNPQIGLTFAAGLRHIVRQDPDVIMVGEIRDRETADIAIRAALTGHLVFLDPAHQRRSQRHHPPHRHGGGELPDDLVAGGGAGAAAGARHLQGLQAAGGRSAGAGRRRASGATAARAARPATARATLRAWASSR